MEARDDRYDTGQLFLHRIFGYRGVILFPWTARVYDRDLHNPSKINATAATPNPSQQQRTKEASLRVKASTSTPPEASTAHGSDGTTSAAYLTNAPGVTESTTNVDAATQVDPKEVKGKVQTFYQVLIDTRDCPHIVRSSTEMCSHCNSPTSHFQRAQTEAVTFLGNQDSNRSLYAIPGLDYVSHEDIMPYSSSEKSPLQHELFDKFLTHAPEADPPFVGQDTLKAWQEKNHPWLDMSDVHKETTENVRITVIPFYMGCRETPASSVYWVRWTYFKCTPKSIQCNTIPVALLHPTGKPWRGERAVARAALANLFAVWNFGDGARQRRRGPGAHSQQTVTRLPVQQPCESAGAQRPYVGHLSTGARGWLLLRLQDSALLAGKQAG